jgi:hypothetical protein
MPQIIFRATEEEREWLRAEARRAKQPLSQFIRVALTLPPVPEGQQTRAGGRK